MKIYSLMVVCICLTSNLNGQLKPRLDTVPSDIDGTILEYNSENGDFRVYMLPDATREMTTIEIVSDAAVFDGPGGPCTGVNGLFDIYTPAKLFKLDPNGFSEHFCEGVARPGLSLEFLAEDLTVSGSLTGGGLLTDVVFLVPEPSAAGLLIFGLLFLAKRKKRSR